MREKKCSCRPCKDSSSTYSKCERDNPGGVNRMQEKKFEDRFDDKELVCVNVEKVYDWIVRENDFEAFPVGPGTAVAFPGITGLTAGTITGATVTCEVVPTVANPGATPPVPPPVELLNREDRQFCIDGKNVCLQQLTIRKNFSLSLTVNIPAQLGGAAQVVTIGTPLIISRNEVVTLCAPEDTAVEVIYTRLNCAVLSTGTLTLAVPGGGAAPTITFSNLVISVNTCQSIQSTFPVTLELLADFCQPREDFVTACPPPSHPPQCPQLFPDHDHGHGHGHGHGRCHDHGCH